MDERPWSLRTSFYPLSLTARGAPRLLEATEIDMETYLEQALGLRQVGYQDKIFFRSPDANEARFFEALEDGPAPVVVLLRTGFAGSPDGPVPFRLTETVYLSDRIQFVMNVGAVPDRLAGTAEVLTGSHHTDTQ